ncbi:MAG: class I SAM-dependent methyltransferase [Candidatus Paceibacterota bacterium]
MHGLYLLSKKVDVGMSKTTSSLKKKGVIDMIDKKTKYWKFAWDIFHLQIFDYEGDVERINDWIKKRNYQVKNILEIGCGAGHYLKYFKKMGYSCVGIDKDVDILEYAKQVVLQEDKDIELVWGDILKKSPLLFEKRFDLVLCKHLSFPLVELDKVLEYATKVLNPNGPRLLVFDFLVATKNDLEEEILSIDSAVKDCLFLVRLNQMRLRKELKGYRWKEIYIIRDSRNGFTVTKINSRSLWFLSRRELSDLLVNRNIEIQNELTEDTGINNLEGVTIYGKFK